MTLKRITAKSVSEFLGPITSGAQNEHHTEVLYNLGRRGHLSTAEEKYAELLTVLTAKLNTYTC